MKKSGSNVKKEIRVIGIDDSPFEKLEKECMIIGTIYRGGNYIDGLVSSKVKIDGNEATKRMVELLKKTRHYQQLNCIMLDGIALAGFNVVDINELSKKAKIPVIVIMRKLPSFRKIQRALNSFMKKSEAEKRMEIIKKAGDIYSTKIKARKIYFQISGITPSKASEIIRTTATHSLIPEPLRVAHLIASGIIKGESRGRA